MTETPGSEESEPGTAVWPAPSSEESPPPIAPATVAGRIVAGAPGSEPEARPTAEPLGAAVAAAPARPEIAVGAAFAGGLLAAMILRRLGG